MLDYFELAKKLNIGNTPLMKFPDCTGGEIFVKCEQNNFSGSIKDRAVLNMIVEAFNSGKLSSGGTIVEATSGNTGISLAAIGSELGFNVVLTMPENMSVERRKLLEKLGAKVVLTEAKFGMSGAIAESKKIAAATKNSVQILQFENPFNTKAHEISTAKEVISQLADLGKIPDAIVAGVGTGGTLFGTAKGVLEVFKNTKIFAVEPAESAVLSGKQAGTHQIQGIGGGFVPQLVVFDVVTEVITVASQQAVEMAKKLNFHYNFPVGISSAANILAAQKVAKKLKTQTVVTFFPDHANRYDFS